MNARTYFCVNLKQVFSFKMSYLNLRIVCIIDEIFIIFLFLWSISKFRGKMNKEIKSKSKQRRGRFYMRQSYPYKAELLKQMYTEQSRDIG